MLCIQNMLDFEEKLGMIVQSFAISEKYSKLFGKNSMSPYLTFYIDYLGSSIFCFNFQVFFY